MSVGRGLERVRLDGFLHQLFQRSEVQKLLRLPLLLLFLALPLLPLHLPLLLENTADALGEMLAALQRLQHLGSIVHLPLNKLLALIGLAFDLARVSVSLPLKFPLLLCEEALQSVAPLFLQVLLCLETK